MRQKGFSLIELLIVVAIILIIAAIAIPNLLRARISANEASAVGSLRTLNTAMVSYASTYPSTQFPNALLSLQPSPGVAPSATASDLLDPVLSGQNPATATPQKSGYTFTLGIGAATTGVPPGVVTYGAVASPITPNTTGIRYFLSDQSGVIRDCGTAAPGAWTGTGVPPAGCAAIQ